MLFISKETRIWTIPRVFDRDVSELLHGLGLTWVDTGLQNILRAG